MLQERQPADPTPRRPKRLIVLALAMMPLGAAAWAITGDIRIDWAVLGIVGALLALSALEPTR